jgi:2-polyprenyl-3-methyl-5-hydroxy-6-metoxy-1,4-benzoquinol methylase
MSMPVPGGDAVIGGNVYPKYTTRNPVARRLVDNFSATLRRLVQATGAREVHEVGCGEGHLSMLLAADGLSVRGCDLSPGAVASARQRSRRRGLDIPFEIANLYDLQPERDGAPLVVCCEVLEHVPDPARALAVLSTLARPHLIVSVPREPLWRLLNLARGHYWHALGNTPGHLQHWSTPAFLHLLQQHLEVVELRTPLPWTMARCRAR